MGEAFHAVLDGADLDLTLIAAVVVEVAADHTRDLVLDLTAGVVVQHLVARAEADKHHTRLVRPGMPLVEGIVLRHRRVGDHIAEAATLRGLALAHTRHREVAARRLRGNELVAESHDQPARRHGEAEAAVLIVPLDRGPHHQVAVV